MRFNCGFLARLLLKGCVGGWTENGGYSRVYNVYQTVFGKRYKSGSETYTLLGHSLRRNILLMVITLVAAQLIVDRCSQSPAAAASNPCCFNPLRASIFGSNRVGLLSCDYAAVFVLASNAASL